MPQTELSPLPTILTLPAETLAGVERFVWDTLPAECGRIEVWEHPHPDHTYVCGADFALGLEGRDYDAACMLDISVNPVRQVCEAHVHLGEDFDRLLFPMLAYYNEAFLCGERQFGISVMRRILNLYGHGWVYYDRDEASRSRKLTDKLGYWRGTGDVCIPNLRRALIEHKIAIRSAELLRQLRNLQYAPKTKAQDLREAQDKHLGIKLKGGGSPDLVMAAAYAWHAANECPKFERPTRRYSEHSLGKILEHEKLDNAQGRGEATAYFRGRRSRPKR